jgi:hypothetical protein
MSTTPSSSESPSPGLVNRLLAGWSRFWFTPADPSLLGLLRIGIGLLVLAVHLVYSQDLEAFFGEHGWIDLQTANVLRLEEEQVVPGTDWTDPAADEEEDASAGQKVIEGHTIWSIWFHVTDPESMRQIHLGMLVVMVLFTLGVWTRVTAVLTWLAFLSCVHRASLLQYGVDTMINVTLLYLMLGPCGAAFSLDSLLARFRSRRSPAPAGGPTPSVAANFSLRLLQVHLCFIYLVSGLTKLQGGEWWNGMAVWNTLVNYELSLARYPWYMDALRALLQTRWLGELVVTACTAFTLFVEIGFPFLVWNRTLRWPMIVAALLLHLGIALFMGLFLFGLSMMPLVLSFVPPEEVRPRLSRLFEVIRGLGGRLWRTLKRQDTKGPLQTAA